MFALKGKELIKTKIMLNNTIMEQVVNFNYLEYQLGSNANYDLEIKLQRSNYICVKIKRKLLNETPRDNPKILQISSSNISLIWQ
jgi:hypothetical protein